MIRSGTPVTPEAVAGHYDELDPYYRALWGEHLHHGYWITGAEAPEVAVEALLDLLAERLRLRPGMRLCDVGCGYGAGAAFFAERFGCDVVGLTLSSRQAERAASRAVNNGRLAILCRDWLANDLPEARFDAVVAIESTEHMSDKARAIREMHRVLKPGGRLAICVWNVASDVPRWQARELIEPICREGRLPSMMSAAEMIELVSGGFEDVDFLDISRSVRRTWNICTRRLARLLLEDRDARRFLRDRRARNRIFALTLVRIMLAYRLGAMRYGVLTATRT